MDDLNEVLQRLEALATDPQAASNQTAFLQQLEHTIALFKRGLASVQ